MRARTHLPAVRESRSPRRDASLDSCAGPVRARQPTPRHTAAIEWRESAERPAWADHSRAWTDDAGQWLAVGIVEIRNRDLARSSVILRARGAHLRRSRDGALRAKNTSSRTEVTRTVDGGAVERVEIEHDRSTTTEAWSGGDVRHRVVDAWWDGGAVHAVLLAIEPGD